MGKNTQLHNPLKPGIYKNDPLTKILGSQLSQRETEVIDLVVQGLYNVEIGKVLGISMKTVEAHMTHLYQRSGIDYHRRVSLAMWWHGAK